MNEIAVALWSMTASRHEWPAPKEPVAIVRRVESRQQPRELPAEEKRMLRDAVECMARCSTGELKRDERTGFYVPVQKADCR